jgi:hypothetical protein
MCEERLALSKQIEYFVNNGESLSNKMQAVSVEDSPFWAPVRSVRRLLSAQELQGKIDIVQIVVRHRQRKH